MTHESQLILSLRAALRAYVTAQGRMRDDWAEGDDAVKQTLWRELHECESFGREVLDMSIRGIGLTRDPA